MPTSLVIVESPAKAKTIAGFLDRSPIAGQDFLVESSVGHIRDLANKQELPDDVRGEWWADLAIDVTSDFKPYYVVHPDKKKKVSELKRLLREADELLLATDEDREGEAIAWHLLEVLDPPARMPVKRMVFHEITPQAIAEAVAHPRDIDRQLVDAQEARRFLDRLYGYEVSPVLWRKVAPKLSAGRVQSVATRLVVERERERMRFRVASYWDIAGTFANMAASDARNFGATLVQVDGRRVATGKDFDHTATAREGVVVLDERAAVDLADGLRERPFTVRSVERKPYRRRPAAPFITSTLQQEAGRKLRLSSAQAMRSAQTLYENGYITYMRTDSTTLSETALAAARATIVERFGAQYLPDAPRQYAKKVKNAQEAHEAIRPAGETFRTPEEVAREVNGTDARVYELIWQRTIASQMTDATGETVSVRLGAVAVGSGTDAEFATSGTVITHQGFRLVYIEDLDEGDAADERERQLPPMAEGDTVTVIELEPQGHDTQPPPRFTEASLVKRLEELGVGRPSTYASTIKTIQDRGYVWKKGSALVPTFTAFAVVNLLEEHFSDLVDYAFTAHMEDELDHIAGGEQELVPWLSDFYFGRAGEGGDVRSGGLKDMVEGQLDLIDPAAINSIPIGADPDGVLIVAKPGRSGSPYIKRGDDTASVPDDLTPDELTVEKALELLALPKGGRDLGVDPATGMPVFAKNGRFGPYVQLGELVDGAKTKPKMASLFKTMTVDRVTLEEALELLELPRVVGHDPVDGCEIVAANGRYGPYIQKNLPDDKKDSRSIDSEEKLLTITLDDCLAILAQPKTRRGQTAKLPLRELGPDPVSGKPMVLKDGRFGPYVTDGETNASLRKGDEVETITDDRAAELLADRRERGPSKRPAKKAAKKAVKKAAKKSTAKKAAKKSTAKKAAPKKATAKTVAAETAAEPSPV